MDDENIIRAAREMNAAAAAHADVLRDLGYRGQTLDVAALAPADAARLDAAYESLLATEAAYEAACAAAGCSL